MRLVVVWKKLRNLSYLAAVSALIALSCSSCALWPGGGSAPQGDRIWFDDLTENKPLSELQRKTTARNIARTLFEDRLPHFAGIDDARPRILFLSASDGESRARVFHAAGGGLLPAARRLLSIASNKLNRPPRWLKIDYVQGVTAPTSLTPNVEIALPGYLWGMSLPDRTRTAFTPGEVLGNGFITSEHTLNTKNVVRYLKNNPDAPSGARRLLRKHKGAFRRFQTASYFSAGKHVERLEYGKKPVGELTPQRLTTALKSAGNYLARSVQSDGRFDYVYNPTDDSVPDSYNMVRHAGTIFSMFQLSQVVDNPELSHAAQRATRYLVDHMERSPVEDQDGLYLAYDGLAKLGSNALGILALVEKSQTTDSPGSLKTAARLARWIVSVQSESGRFRIHRQHHPGGRRSHSRCKYYPGEVIFALTRLYQADGNEQWLRAAEKSARYLITERDKNKSMEELPHDHWLLYGLNELYRLRPRKMYLQHARRLALTIARSQNLEPRNPAWHGSYYHPPRSAPTATRTEGLCAAYFLERDHGDNSRAEQFFKAAYRGVKFQLLTHVRAPTAMHFANPPRAMGGFTYSLEDPRIRIDVVQHNISALLSMRRMLMKR